MKEKVHRKLSHQLPIVLTDGEDDFMVAMCPLIPGCISQGKTRDEALSNIREAIELCLQMQEQEGWTLPEHYEVVAMKLAA
ncbi:MAG: type II toxin-antitoxin system HicB family antitoxin [Myxococcota bacterium]